MWYTLTWRSKVGLYYRMQHLFQGSTSTYNNARSSGDDAMAFQRVPNTAAIIIEFLGNTVICQNTLYAEKLSGYDIADLQLLAATVDANVGAAWLDEISLDYAYVRTIVRGLDQENDFEVEDNTSAGPGTDVAGSLPGNVTISIKKSSGQTGRSARGRLYWVGTPRSFLAANENQMIPAKVADIVSNVGSMRGSIDGTVWTPVLVSRFTAGAKRAVGETFPWISESAVDDNMDSLRNRLL